MPSRSIVPALLALVVVVGFVYTRAKRGRRLLVLRSRRSAPRLVLNVVFLVVAGLGLVASMRSARGPWDSISSLSIILFSLSDMGFDLYGRPQPGQCSFHENGILMVDGRRPMFSRWDEFERYEWQGDTLVFHLAATGLAHVGDVRAIDVPPERRGDVLAVIAPRLRG
jgi:hypothetical protein